MVALVWGAAGAKTYETGLDRGVLFLSPTQGYAWNGLISVEETPSGGEVESFHYDGIKYMDYILSEDYQSVLTSFGAPRQFASCDGSREHVSGLFITGQPRARFSLCYRTRIGSDLSPDAGYKIHIVYNLMASPSSKTRNTVNESPEAAQMAWTLNAVPKAISTYKPTAHLIVDSRYSIPANLTSLEQILYGTSGADPFLPEPSGVISILD